MSESPIVKCENCDGKIERVITGGSGLIFKGSGFYLTDYKDADKSSNDKKEKTSDSSKQNNKSDQANIKNNNKNKSKKNE